MSTTDDLKTAFAGESQANRKYLAYAAKAEHDGFPIVARLFRAVAEAETLHAHSHFRAMGGVKATLDNLTDAQAGEKYEFTTMYPPMVSEAKTEKQKQAEQSLHGAMEVEKVHYALFERAIAAVKSGHDLAGAPIRICPVCGHTVIGDAPDACPVCGCPGARYREIA